MSTPPRPEDAHALAALHAEAFDAPWSETAFSDLLAAPGVAVEVDADGFILTQTAADEAEILTLAVRPSARRRGLGRRLVEAAVARARLDGVERLFLEVAVGNAPARALYAACGFDEVGRRPGYYARAGGRREDALILALSLR